MRRWVPSGDGIKKRAKKEKGGYIERPH